jgi:hypothetical protein
VFAIKLANDFFFANKSTSPMLKNLFSLALLLAANCLAHAQNCLTAISYSNLPTGGRQLTAIDSSASQAVAYQWDTGDNTQSISVFTTGTYCVTVTYAGGCTASACHFWPITGNCGVNLWITTDTTTGQQVWMASGYPYYTGPWSFVWGNGDTGPTTPFGPPGLVCVTATNPAGCVADTCYNTDGDCIAWLESVNGELPLVAGGNGAPPLSFSWSTGETSSEISPNDPGYYCVTVTDADGCASQNCIWYNGPGNPANCSIQMIGLHCSNGFYQIGAFSTDPALPIVGYQWSNGSTFVVLNVDEPGNYCVTATNSQGCTAVNCYPVCAKDSAQVTVTLGQDSSQTGNFPAEVFVIQYDTAQGGILTGIDTLLTDAFGNLLIEDLPNGPYLLKAALLPGSPDYDDYLPTYYPNSLLWSGATPIQPLSTLNWNGDCAVPHFWIGLIHGQNPGGPGFIGGLVSQGANLTGSGDEPEGFGEGDPFPGASVVLTLLNGTPVAATVTNAEGEYSFPNLAWGTYILTLDIPGLAPVSITVTIGPSQPSVMNVNFKVDENSVALPTQEVRFEKLVKIFPNPVLDILTVELPAPAELSLTNAQGQTVVQTSENDSQARLTLRDLPSGIYFLTVRMANDSQVLKVMIE